MQAVRFTDGDEYSCMPTMGGFPPMPEEESTFEYFQPCIPLQEWMRRFALTMTGKYSPRHGFRLFDELRGTENGTVLVIGGGPSLRETLPQVRARIEDGAKVFALNGSHDWLLTRGITPDYACQADGREWVDYITPRAGIKYIMFSQLPGATLDRFVPYRDSTYICHNDPMFPSGESAAEISAILYPDCGASFFGWGSTIGITSLPMMQILGFSYVECHGFDSCFRDDVTHAYDKPRVHHERYRSYLTHPTTGERFSALTNASMEFQAASFAKIIADPGELTIRIGIAGTGAIPWMAARSPNKQVFHAYPQEIQ